MITVEQREFSNNIPNQFEKKSLIEQNLSTESTSKSTDDEEENSSSASINEYEKSSPGQVSNEDENGFHTERIDDDWQPIRKRKKKRGSEWKHVKPIQDGKHCLCIHCGCELGVSYLKHVIGITFYKTYLYFLYV